jgi:hypothetical protein
VRYHSGPGIRRDTAERPFGNGHGFIEQFVRAYHTESFELHFLGDSREQATVAQQAIADLGEEFRRPPIRPDCGEGRPPHAAGIDHVGDAMRA